MYYYRKALTNGCPSITEYFAKDKLPSETCSGHRYSSGRKYKSSTEDNDTTKDASSYSNNTGNSYNNDTGTTSDNTGGNTGGSTGGNTGGSTGGNTGGSTGGNTGGGSTGGNTGGGSTGGQVALPTEILLSNHTVQAYDIYRKVSTGPATGSFFQMHDNKNCGNKMFPQFLLYLTSKRIYNSLKALKNQFCCSADSCIISKLCKCKFCIFVCKECHFFKWTFDVIQQNLSCF